MALAAAQPAHHPSLPYSPLLTTSHTGLGLKPHRLYHRLREAHLECGGVVRLASVFFLKIRYQRGRAHQAAEWLTTNRQSALSILSSRSPSQKQVLILEVSVSLLSLSPTIAFQSYAAYPKPRVSHSGRKTRVQAASGTRSKAAIAGTRRHSHFVP